MSGAGERADGAAERARGRWAEARARRRSMKGLDWGRRKITFWEKVGMVFDLLDVFSLFK